MLLLLLGLLSAPLTQGFVTPPSTFQCTSRLTHSVTLNPVPDSHIPSWHRPIQTKYPDLVLGPCTTLDFGIVQDNYAPIRVDKNDYEACSNLETYIPLTNEQAPASTPDHIVYELTNLATTEHFTDKLGSHCTSKQKFEVTIAPPPLWGYQGGSTETDVPHDIAVDPLTGSIVIVGSTRGPLVASDRIANDANTGQEDCFVQKINPITGLTVFSLTLASTRSERCISAVVSKENSDIYVTGTTQEGIYTAGANGFADVFVTRFNLAGVEQEHALFESPGVDYAVGISLLSSGNIALLSMHSDSDHRIVGDASTYGGDYISTLTVASTVQGLTDSPLYTTNFVTDEGNAGAEADSDAGVGVSVPGRDVDPRGILVGSDASGNDIIYITGVTSGNGASVGVKKAGKTRHTFDSFVTAVNAATGDILHSYRTQEVDGNVVAGGICIDSFDDVILVGHREDTVAGKKVGFVKKLSRNSLDLVWERELSGSNDDGSMAVDCTGAEDGVIAVVGNTIGGTNNKGDYDVFISRLDAVTGELLSTQQQLGTTAEDVVGTILGVGTSLGRKLGGITSDVVGNLYVMGSTRGELADKALGNGDFWVARSSRGQEGTFLDLGTWEERQVEEKAPNDDDGIGWWGAMIGVVVLGGVLGVGFLIGKRYTEGKYSRVVDDELTGLAVETGKRGTGGIELVDVADDQI